GAVDFYCGVLGGEVVRRRSEPDNRVWIRLAEVSLEIAEIAATRPLDPEQRRALPLLGFAVAPADLDAVVERLRGAEVPHEGPVLKLAGEAVGGYLSDPDGNG